MFEGGLLLSSGLTPSFWWLLCLYSGNDLLHTWSWNVGFEDGYGCRKEFSAPYLGAPWFLKDLQWLDSRVVTFKSRNLRKHACSSQFMKSTPTQYSGRFQQNIWWWSSLVPNVVKAGLSKGTKNQRHDPQPSFWSGFYIFGSKGSQKWSSRMKDRFEN